MLDQVDINLLGGVAVRGRGTPPTARAIGLLAYLVLHAGMPQSRAHLATLFWPDSRDAQARTNLRRELHQLRAVLGQESCIDANATTLTWRDIAGYRVDARDFQRAAAAAIVAATREDVESLRRHATAAIEAYRGPLLPGWLDEWVLTARDELERQCIELCDRMLSIRRKLDFDQALAIARRRIQLAPLEEPGYALLMRLQAEHGDRGGAVTTYHRCASILETELGVTPSPALVRGLEAILGGSLGSGPQSAGSRRGSPATVEAATLVGRTDELDVLLTRWRAALAGSPGLVLVTGDAGVGKSRLVGELARHVTKDQAVVASARCFGATGRLALAPIADWLRTPAVRSATSGLEPGWQAEVDRLLPRGPIQAQPGGPARAKVDAWQRLRFFEGLARGLLAPQRPTLLVLDDVQWCDNESMVLITFLLELAAEAPILVAATARDDELADNVAVLGTLRPLRSVGRLTEVTLGPFRPDETADVARHMLGRPPSSEDVTLLQSATGGYPLYVVEALRTWAAGSTGVAMVPDDLSAVLRQRLLDASEAARALAGLAAAVGRDFGLELLSEASDSDADTVVRAVDELWRRRILRQAGAGYDFSHDLLRSAVYDATPPARRWLHHRRLAQGLELLHAGRLDDVASQLADQHARSGRPDRALPFYSRAAALAASVFASAEAVRLLERSLDLVTDLPVGASRDRQELEALVAISAPLNALYGYGDPRLKRVLTRSVDLAEQLGQAQVLLPSMVALWACTFVQGDVSASDGLARRALELSQGVPELAGQAHLAAGGSALALGNLDVAVEHLDLARDLSLGAVSLTVGTRPEVHAQAWAAHGRSLLGDWEGAARDAREAVQRARESQHPYTLAVALAYASITHQMSGDVAALDAHLAELGEVCNRYEFAYYREWGLILSGWRHGGTAGAELMRKGLRNLTHEHSLVRMPYWLSLLAENEIGMRNHDVARATLDAAQVAAAQRNDNWWLPEVLRLSASLQPPDSAESTLLRAMEIASAQSSQLLLERCQDDLRALGATTVRSVVDRLERFPNA